MGFLQTKVDRHLPAQSAALPVSPHSPWRPRNHSLSVFLLPGAGAWVIMQAVQERQEREGGQGHPVTEAPATEGEGAEEESRDETPADNAALVDEMNHDGGSGSSGQDRDQQQEPIPGGSKDHQVLPCAPVQLPRFRHRFTQFQLQELERIFERNHYPSAVAR